MGIDDVCYTMRLYGTNPVAEVLNCGAGAVEGLAPIQSTVHAD